MNTNFNSQFKLYIHDLINQKCSIGYKYETEVSILLRFDSFCCTYFPETSELTKELVESWAMKRETESFQTLKGRITPIRHLAELMNRQGINAYVFPKGKIPKSNQYQPSIFSDLELENFLNKRISVIRIMKYPFVIY